MKAYNPMKAVSCEQMRKIDAAAIAMGIPGIVLMENAAVSVVNRVLEYSPQNVLIMCGKGQNGGDGFAVARHLACRDIPVDVVLLCDEENIKGNAKTNFEAIKNMGIDITPFSQFSGGGYDVIVDALLGTGIKGQVTGAYASAIEYINSSNSTVISVDIPSGINGDNGEVCGVAVKACETVTFAFYKTGLVSDLSADYVGRVIVADISIPHILPEVSTIRTEIITAETAKQAFPQKSRSAHKGTMGRVYIVGGSVGMAGAVCMASSAAERSGAGLVTCIVPGEILDIVMKKITGSMCKPLKDDVDFANADTLLIGNGMGNNSVTREYVEKALAKCSNTLIIDADGLNVLNGADEIKNTKAKVIITPHIGEMSRLTGIPTAEIIKDKLNIALDFAKTSGAVVVLKGANTVVATPEGQAYINNRGTPAMAKGGSGDILAGLIAGISAKGTPLCTAACAGVFLHAVAGELAEMQSGEYSVIPEEITACISKAITNL